MPATAEQTNDIQTPLDGARVLVVEDEVLIALDLMDALAEVGAIPTHARTLKQALKAAERPFDIALLDLSLCGGENCLSVIALLREQGVPIVLHSGDVEHYSDLPADLPVVHKPADTEVVLAALQRGLR